MTTYQEIKNELELIADELENQEFQELDLDSDNYYLTELQG